MKGLRFLSLGMVVSIAMPLTASAAEEDARPAGPKPGEYGDPTRFEKDIRSFEATDATNRPPEGAVVCTGSSSMKGWHKDIRQDLAPLTVIPRGFGGSTMNDLLHYVDRVVIAYKPRAVVVYEGDNDIKGGIAPEKLVEKLQAFVARVHEKLPETRIYVLSVKPSPSRWTLWDSMKRANALIRAYCQGEKRLTYIDISAGMLDETGKPRPDIYQKDNLHMVRKGYEIWRDAVRPVLLAVEEKYERKSEAAVPGPKE